MSSTTDNHEHHVVPLWFLAAIFLALVALTVITVGATKVDLGANGNLFIAMAIATVKALLVVFFFMHLWWERGFNLVFFGASLVAMALFVSFLVMDTGQYQYSVVWPDELVYSGEAAEGGH